MRILIFIFLFSAIGAEAQIPSLGISKKMADTCTINFENPEIGQYIRLYPRNFIADTSGGKTMIADEFFDTLAIIIEKLPGCTFEIAAHTSSEGPSTRNFNFSQKRAASMVAYLVRYCNIPRGSLMNKGYGETKPIIVCGDQSPCTKEANEKNQRLELVIIDIPNN
jgi:flagellar motor protein MotB